MKQIDQFICNARTYAVSILRMIDRDISNVYARAVCASIVYLIFFLVGLLASVIDGAAQWGLKTYRGLLLVT